MQYYKYHCDKCQTTILSPRTEEQHKKECDGKFKGLLLR